jgi:hypothetical protein
MVGKNREPTTLPVQFIHTKLLLKTYLESEFSTFLRLKIDLKLANNEANGASKPSHQDFYTNGESIYRACLDGFNCT